MSITNDYYPLNLALQYDFMLLLILLLLLLLRFVDEKNPYLGVLNI